MCLTDLKICNTTKFKSHFQKADCKCFTCNYVIIEANRIDFHFQKMRLSFSALEKIHSVQNEELRFSLKEKDISFVTI